MKEGLHLKPRPLEYLIADRHPSPEWAVVYELSGMVGSRGIDRRADVVAFNCWPSKNHLRVAYEVKRTRSDFQSEINHPEKRAWLEKYFHQTYFVVAHGIVKPEEVPEGWGIYIATKAGDKLQRRLIARHREPEDLPDYITLSAIRALSERLHREMSREYYFEKEVISRDDLTTKVMEMVSHKQEQMEKEWNDVRKLRQTLSDQKRDLRAPLLALARAAGRYGFYGSDEGKISTEDVHKWIERVRAASLERAMGPVRSAHTSLERLIKVVDEYPKEGDNGRTTAKQA